MSTLKAEQQRILDVIYERPVEIAHWLGRDKMGELHNEWLKLFLFAQKDITLQAHRGSYKTTTLAVFLALHCIVKPNEPLIYFRKTDINVADVAREVRRYLESGCLRKLTYQLYGLDLVVTRANNTAIDVNLHTAAGGQALITGFGIGSSVTGKHADLIITDDIVTVEDRVSASGREQTKRAYQELQNIKNRGGRIINLGTPWHKEDAFILMPTPIKYDCYSSGMLTDEQIQELRGKMTPSLFAANYELRHIADGDALFDEPRWAEDSDLLLNGRAHIDAAYGGEDYTAYTVMKRLPDGRIIAFGRMWHKHVDDCIAEIKAYQERFRAGSIACETNADKGYLRAELARQGLYAEGYPESQNKFVKIVTHLRSAWQNIYWVKETDPNYLAQILDYTENAEHDDAPDSAASLVRRMTTNKARVLDKRKAGLR